MKNQPVAHGTRARNEAIDPAPRVMALEATLVQIALVSVPLVAERMMMPYVELFAIVTLLPVTVASSVCVVPPEFAVVLPMPDRSMPASSDPMLTVLLFTSMAAKAFLLMFARMPEPTLLPGAFEITL